MFKLERKPIIPVSPERREKLLNLPGYIILGRPPNNNAWQGYVEHSFSMDWDKNYVNFWWSGDAVSNFGTKHVIDGFKTSNEHYKEQCIKHPDWVIEIFDVHDPDTPVILDWEAWINAHATDPNTLSGVSNKFAARNFKFQMKE